MVVLPLQVLIHRHHQTVTAETQKLPPLARVKAVDVWCVTSCSPVYGQEEGNSRTAAVGTAVLVAIAYYSGHVVIWNLVDGSSRGIWVCHEQPLRSVRFLQQKEPPLQRPRRDGQTYSCRLVVAGDDGRLVLVEVCSDTRIVVRHSVAAHSDFCRSVDVHPTLPLVLSASDDCSVKVWQVVDGNDTEEDEDRLVLFQALEGHDDFVMQVRCHPDGTSFVSASLDHTIHRWDIEGSSSSGALIVSPTPAATFCGHTDGVNCVDFLIDDSGNTRLVSGSDDSSIRIWNYRDAGLVFSIINAHRDNINAIVAHPSLPLMVSACEDGTCHAWSVERGLVDGMKKRQSPDVSLRGVWNLDRGRAWALAWAGHDEIALGFDHGPVLLRLESDSSACRGKVHSRARSLAFVDFEDPHGSSRSDRVDRGQAESSVSVFESMIISDADGRTVIHVSPGTSECER
jgi:coatomer subunit beta'